MFRVDVEGVRRNFRISSAYFYAVNLVDDPRERLFIFLVERHEAFPIVAALQQMALPRPQTINVMAETLQSQGQTLKELHIESLSMSPVYLFSTTLLWQDATGRETSQQITMRPGDALGLALLMQSPIFFADDMAPYAVPLTAGKTPELVAIHDLLKISGITLPPEQKLRLGFSKTPMRDALIKEVKAALAGKAPIFPEEDIEQRKQEILAFVLGGEIPASTQA